MRCCCYGNRITLKSCGGTLIHGCVEGGCVEGGGVWRERAMHKLASKAEKW